MLNLARRLFGTRNERYLKSIQPLVDKINALEEKIKPSSDEDLKNLTIEYKKRFAEGESLDSLLPEAFATVREAASRTLGERHYDVQLVGGIVLHQGKIPEMKTGEGKTLVSTLAAYLNALSGKGVHVVTVNDYLAKRDSEWMAQVFNALGLSCSYIIHGMNNEERKAAYAADITYATNNELGFDYLRDNMAFNPASCVQRDLNFAIVDEVDSILIDEARVPLVISGPVEDKTELYQAMDKFIPQLVEGEDFDIDEKGRTANLTDEGTDKVEVLLKSAEMLAEGESLYDMQHVMLVHHINQALRAHVLFQRDVHYIVNEGQIVLIDEFTGRMTPGKRLSEGLHQAIEAKEGVDIQNENQTLASITYQNYFRMYDKLSGMTGTAETEAEEFETIYGLEVIIIPPHRHIARMDSDDVIYRTAKEKLAAMVNDVKDCYERGQPVLVGTTSIEKSEELSELLKKADVEHKVLNARHHDKEAEIVAQAGRFKAVTIATNMAGRGTDIKLGGNLEMLLEGVEDEKQIAKLTKQYKDEKEAVMEAGGLRVIGTERHESRRIDNQLRGRSGRQGDVGSSVFYISLEDDLMRIFANNMMDRVMGSIDWKEGEALQHKLVSKSLEIAQRKIEGRNFDVRKQLLKFDDVLNDQRKVIYEQRKEIMESEAVDDIVLEFREELVSELVEKHFPAGTYEDDWSVEEFKEDLNRYFNIQPKVEQWLEEDGVDPDDVEQRTQKHVAEVWKNKEERLTAPVMRSLEKGLMLQMLDFQWKDHLQRLDFLRQGIFLRAHGQKDPLNEYKSEAFRMFENLLVRVRDEVTAYLSRVELRAEDEAAIAQTAAEANQIASAKKPLSEEELKNLDIPRNSPCPCGSGKKYKHCHGAIK